MRAGFLVADIYNFRRSARDTKQGLENIQSSMRYPCSTSLVPHRNADSKSIGRFRRIIVLPEDPSIFHPGVFRAVDYTAGQNEAAKRTSHTAQAGTCNLPPENETIQP
jgi:hypothetical protein